MRWCRVVLPTMESGNDLPILRRRSPAYLRCGSRAVNRALAWPRWIEFQPLRLGKSIAKLIVCIARVPTNPLGTKLHADHGSEHARPKINVRTLRLRSPLFHLLPMDWIDDVL